MQGEYEYKNNLGLRRTMCIREGMEETLRKKEEASKKNSQEIGERQDVKTIISDRIKSKRDPGDEKRAKREVSTQLQSES